MRCGYQPDVAKMEADNVLEQSELLGNVKSSMKEQ